MHRGLWVAQVQRSFNRDIKSASEDLHLTLRSTLWLVGGPVGVAFTAYMLIKENLPTDSGLVHLEGSKPEGP